MTLVQIHLRSPGEFGPVPAIGRVSWMPTKRRDVEDFIELPDDFSVTLVEGLAEVEVAATGVDWVWKVNEYVAGGLTRYVAVPNTGPAAYMDLVDIDPATLEPSAVPEAAWIAMANSTVTSGAVVGDDLILTRTDETTVNAGNVRGLPGTDGTDGADGTDGSDATATTDASQLTSGTLADARLPASAQAATLTAAFAAKAPLVSPAFTGTPTGITKTHVGLGSVDDTSDASKPVSTAQQTALNLKLNASEKAAANGVASLGADGKVPSAQIPESSGGGVGMNPISGSYAILNPGAPGSATLSAAGNVSLTPVYLPAAMSITEFWAYTVTASASSTVQLGYYTNVGSAFTKQATFGTIDTSTTGAKTLAGTWTLPAGVIWLAWVSLGGTATMRGTTTTPMVPGPMLTSSLNTLPYNDVKTMDGPTGQASLPASITSSAMSSTASPVRFAGKWA